MSDRGEALSPWLPPLAMMALIFALSSIPGGGVNDTLQGPLRKVSHFAEFAVLAALWRQALRSRVRPRAALAGAFVLTVAYAVLDEIHQGFVEGRYTSGLDVLIDAGGAATALALLARRRVRSRA